MPERQHVSLGALLRPLLVPQLAQRVGADAVLQRPHLCRDGTERHPEGDGVVAGEAAVRRVLVPGKVLTMAVAATFTIVAIPIVANASACENVNLAAHELPRQPCKRALSCQVAQGLRSLAVDVFVKPKLCQAP